MTTIAATIIADSVSPEGIRLTTMHLRYPRFIHAEFMTHRVFSRNARSSRAVPVETMLREVEDDPVVPLFWGANQRGMQADRECDAGVWPLGEWVPTEGYPERPDLRREGGWLWARDRAVEAARAFHEAGYHKQIVNRLLEPFMHIDTLVTATEWANFLALRDHPAAEPHIAVLAREMRAAMAGSTPEPLCGGEWHLPYVREEDAEAATALYGARAAFGDDVLIKLSVARCARISYRPFDGEGSIEAEIARHDALVGATPMHASPAEHQATPDELIVPEVPEGGWYEEHQHGNFRGWRQYRRMLANESLTEVAA